MKVISKLTEKLGSQTPESLDSRISFIESGDPEDIENYTNKDVFINIYPVNNIRHINKFHEAVNKKLEFDSVYVSCCETLDNRAMRIKETGWLSILNPLISFCDFLGHRVIHKITVLNKLYFFITNGKNRPLSKAEALGRIISCGFEIYDVCEIDGLLYIFAKKKTLPEYNMKASFSFFFPMTRVGYRGELISVYKIRTMHPFSEYLQNYIIENNELSDKGKVNNDYRITSWGKFFRKIWLDELPMLVNFFKGQVNVVGVRPLSQDMFERYPQELQNLRVRVKPGLVPPFYADIPSSLSEVFQSEEKYILKKLDNPWRTDWIYFWKAIMNILFRGARSK